MSASQSKSSREIPAAETRELLELVSLCLSGCLSRARYVGESAEDDPNLLGRAEATG